MAIFETREAWQCDCEVKVRVASDQFEATCNRCGSRFTRSA